MVQVLVAPDSFGGTLTPVQAARAIAAGWRRARPHDDVVELPMSDGGEGLVEAVHPAMPDAQLRRTEVVDARGLVTEASWLLEPGTGRAVLESARACGLAALAPEHRDPLRTTSWGVGQLLDAARTAGAREVLLGLGGTATVDGGAGALSGLGFRLTVADGSGLKIGGEDLPRVAAAAPTWVGDWDGVDVRLLADVSDRFAAAPSRYGPQKGADAPAVAHLERGLAALRAVLERDLGAPAGLADRPGTGAAGGLPYALAAGLGASIVRGVDVVAGLLDWERRTASAAAIVTGEGRLDATTGAGKVVDFVLRRAGSVPVGLVVGQQDVARPDGVVDLEVAAPDGPGDDPAAEVAAAAERLAGRWAGPVG